MGSISPWLFFSQRLEAKGSRHLCENKKDVAFDLQPQSSNGGK
jgi:hypothetical protein